MLKNKWGCRKIKGDGKDERVDGKVQRVGAQHPS